MPPSTPEQLGAAIAALQAQRALLGDAVVDTALAPLRKALAECSAPAAEATPAQQLKQVSVLFVDVVGSTAMGQQLDPETIHAVMDSALERFTAVVQAEHGRVLQYTGDGMLAAFGTETAGEDDVESAIRAGLGIIEAARVHAPRVRAEHGVADFDVRAGVHTGTVLLGGGVDAEGSIRGAAVNIAARMEQSAPPGRLRISHDSWRQVRGLFEVVEQAAISVKGVQQPLRSFLVERALPREQRGGPRGIEGLHTPMVARAAEFELLQRLLAEATHEQRARAVTIVGEAGLGKTRLLNEFRQTLDPQQCWLLLGRAHPRSALQPFGLLRDMLARQLQIGENDDVDVARRKLVGTLAPLLAGEGMAPVHLIGQLIGLDFSTSAHVKDLLGDARRFKALAFEAAALYLRRLGTSRPVIVLVLDDLHWADADSIEFMQYVMSRDGDVPLLSLTLTRQTVFEHASDWTAGNAAHTRLELKPLDATASGELAAALLQHVAEVPAALRELIVGAADGNPFFMEELVKMLIDDGVIVVEAESWRVLPERLRLAHVPATLTGVLQARLDALPARERLALQQAAVVGHVFWDRALAAVDATAIEALPLLLRKQLIVHRDEAAFDDSREYAFKHQLLHQVSYDSVLKGAKRAGHARAGAFWSERAEVSEPQQVNPARCRALAEAQYHRTQTDARDYMAWFEVQFGHYLNAYAAQTLRPLAAQLVESCEREFGGNDAHTARALTNLARVMLMQGDVEPAQPLLARAIAIQEAALGSEHPDTARTLAVLGGYHQGRGDLRAAEPYFRRALAIREHALGSEHPLTLDALDYLAKTIFELDRLDEAEALFRKVLAARERGSGAEHADTAFALTALGEVLAKKGRHAQAEPLIRRALAIQQVALPADHPDSALSMWHLAETLRGLSRHDEAEPLARRTLQVWQDHFGADHEWTAWALISLSEIRLAQGDAGEAAETAQRAAAVLEKVFGPAHGVLAATLVLQAHALLVLHQPQAAAPLLQRAQAIFDSGDDAGGAAAALCRELALQAQQMAPG